MALAPVDFYAYSRATGVPVPEDPEERAALAPQVAEFRRNQFRAPQEESQLPGILGAAALGLGLLGAGAIAARRFGRGIPKAAQPKAAGISVADLETVARAKIPTPAPAPSKVVVPESAIPQATVSLSDIQDFQAPQISRQQAQAADPGLDQVISRVDRSIQRDTDFVKFSRAADVITERSNRLQAVSNQINSFQQELDQLQSTGVNLPASVGTTSAQSFLQRERDEIASQLGEQGLPISPTRVEEELSRRLGQQAFGYGPKYSARRQALELYAQTGDPQLLEQVKLFGMSPVTFETFENMPAAKKAGFETAPPFSTEYYPSEEVIPVGLSSNISVTLPGAGEAQSIADIRRPVITEATAQQAEEYYQTKKGKALDWLGELRVELEPKRNAILKERQMLAEQSARKIIPQLEAARQAGQSNVVAELEQSLENLRTLYRNPRLGAHRADELNYLDTRIANAQNKIAEDISSVQKKYPTTLRDWSGGSGRIFGELDPNTGEFIPETVEVRGERPSRELPLKGGGGRNIAEYTAGERLDEEIRAIQGGGRIRDYDPETGAAYQPWTGDKTQTGREIDIYGIRPSGEKRANPELRPSEPQYTKQEIANEAMRMSAADPYGDVPVAPDYEAVIQNLGYQEPTPERKASVLLSEQVRKGQLQYPRQNIGPYPSTPLSNKPTGPIVPQQQVTQQPVQLSLPSDVVPEAGRAQVRRTPADIAANQLESYMSKLQRGRSTPLTSSVRIQPTLF